MKPSESRKLSLEKAAKAYEQNIDKAAGYLASRGVSQETAKALRLGLVEEAEPGHSQFVGRLAIPYITRGGIVDMKFRCVEHEDCKEYDCIKYLALPGLNGSRLYNVNAFFSDSDYIGLCEGEPDTWILHYEVGVPAVGCPGVQRWEPHFSRCFAGYSKVFVFADGDQAGREFGKRVASELPQALVIEMDRGADVNSTFLDKGKDALLSMAGLLPSE